MKLPQYIIDSVERRWAAKLQQEAEAWRQRKRPQLTQEHSRSTRATLPPKRIERLYSFGRDYAT